MSESQIIVSAVLIMALIFLLIERKIWQNEKAEDEQDTGISLELFDEKPPSSYEVEIGQYQIDDISDIRVLANYLNNLLKEAKPGKDVINVKVYSGFKIHVSLPKRPKQ